MADVSRGAYNPMNPLGWFDRLDQAAINVSSDIYAWKSGLQERAIDRVTGPVVLPTPAPLPVSPQTAPQMTEPGGWTPEISAAAQADAWTNYSTTAFDNIPISSGPSWQLILAALGLGVLGIVALKGRRY